MQGTRLLGGAVAVLGMAGYVAGVAVDYPGRSFAITAVMLGVTLVAVGGERP
jgi:hypothetical protein